MYNNNIPPALELPSTKRLLKSTAFAALIAGVLLVTVVMPAEYGIDPTGIGDAIGLKQMGEIKVSLAREAAADRAADQAAVTKPAIVPPTASDTPSPSPAVSPAPPPPLVTNASQQHETTVTLAPDQGTEVKVTMTKGNKVRYNWSTDGGKANYDAHGDSKALGINYHSYSKGSKESEQGEIEAAFDGSHGWFWRNRTSTPMTITLQTDGQYTQIKRF